MYAWHTGLARRYPPILGVFFFPKRDLFVVFSLEQKDGQVTNKQNKQKTKVELVSGAKTGFCFILNVVCFFGVRNQTPRFITLNLGFLCIFSMLEFYWGGDFVPLSDRRLPSLNLTASLPLKNDGLEDKISIWGRSSTQNTWLYEQMFN